MPKFKDITGKKFNYLTAIKRIGTRKVKNSRCTVWLFLCDCGNEKELIMSNVTKKKAGTVSCGCKKLDFAKTGLWKYGSKASTKNLKNKLFGCLVPLKIVGTCSNGKVWECLCKCGRKKNIQSRHLLSGGIKTCGCALMRKGEDSPNWKGGKYKSKEGYVLIYNPNYRKLSEKYLLEHRLKMEKKLGRKLHDAENVHHKNGIRDDNRMSNLELWVSSQPSGQRAQDLVKFAREILDTYGELF